MFGTNKKSENSNGTQGKKRKKRLTVEDRINQYLEEKEIHELSDGLSVQIFNDLSAHRIHFMEIPNLSYKNLGAAIQIDQNWIKIKQQDTIIKQQAEIIQLLKETREIN